MALLIASSGTRGKDNERLNTCPAVDRVALSVRPSRATERAYGSKSWTNHGFGLGERRHHAQRPRAPGVASLPRHRTGGVLPPGLRHARPRRHWDAVVAPRSGTKHAETARVLQKNGHRRLAQEGR